MKKLLAIVVLGLLLSSNVYSKTIVVKANPEKGFNFPYLLKTSKKTSDAKYLIVESNNTGNGKSIKDMTSKAKKSLGWVLGSDIAKKLNFPLLFPVNDETYAKNRKSLWRILKENIINKRITELYFDRNDNFKDKMSFNDVMEVVSFTELINGVQTSAEELKSIDISGYRIKGMWYFDKRQGEMKYRLLGLMPIGKNLKDDDGKNNTDLFWIWYPSIRKILHEEKVFNDKNNASSISFDQLLVSRRFSSFIYKEDNVYGDRSIKEYKIPGLESILESQRIKKEILDFEQDMWNR